MFQLSVKELHKWMTETLGEHSTAATIEAYLLARGESTMLSCVHGNNQQLIKLAQLSDRLGWDSLLEGRIATYWLEVTAPLLNRDGQFLLPEVWGRKFINRLHKIVHAQWVYHNALIHYKDRDGFTNLEQHEIFNKVEEFALRDPDTLLPRHRFLFQADFETLGSRPTSD